jgi:hypothetical protein
MLPSEALGDPYPGMERSPEAVEDPEAAPAVMPEEQDVDHEVAQDDCGEDVHGFLLELGPGAGLGGW